MKTASLKPLQPKSPISAFLDKRLEGIRLQDELKDFLISFTDGRPFYIDIIASKLVDIAAQLQFKWLNTAHISQALEDLLFDSKGTINQYFQNLISGFLERPLMIDYLDILSTVSEGKRKLNQIHGGLTGKKGNISTKIERLIEENFISKNGFVHYFNDRVFEFWLKNVYNKKRYSMVSIFQDRSNIFKKEVEGLISIFIAENKKNVYDRMQDLLKSFNNEVLKVDEKSLKFPRFDNIQIEGFTERSGEFFIRASYAPQKSWILQYSHQCVDESQMLNFIDRFNGIKPTPQKKILIAFSGIDTNAMLIAKENKIWIWRQETLNLISSLYGKFKFFSKD